MLGMIECLPLFSLRCSFVERVSLGFVFAEAL